MSLVQPRSLLAGAIATTGFGVALVSALGLAGSWSWQLDLFSHFRLQYAIIAFVLLLISAATRNKWLVGGLSLLFALLLIPLLPLVFGGDQPNGSGTPLRVVHFNVLVSNRQQDEVSRWVKGQDADILVAQEVNQSWVEKLDAELEGMTRLDTSTFVGFNTFGIAVYVDDDLAVDSVEVLGPDTTPAIAVSILTEPDADPFLLYAIHTMPPLGTSKVDHADSQIDQAIDQITDHDGPVVVVGDLNTTRWSSQYRRLTGNTGLRDGGAGFGLKGTWPSMLWVTGMIRIDHLVVSDQIRIEDHRLGPELGSDHLPVIADIVVVSSSN